MPSPYPRLRRLFDIEQLRRTQEGARFSIKEAQYASKYMRSCFSDFGDRKINRQVDVDGRDMPNVAPPLSRRRHTGILSVRHALWILILWKTLPAAEIMPGDTLITAEIFLDFD